MWHVVRWIVAGCVLAMAGVATRPARAESGEYTARVVLAPHGLAGTRPTTLDTPSGPVAGTAALSVDLAGRVTGSLASGGNVVPVSGTLRVSGASSKLTLKSSKSLGVTFRGSLSSSSAAGQLTDRRGLLGGSGALLIDLSLAPPLEVSLAVAIRNGVRAKRTGFVDATSSGDTVRVAATARVTPSASRLRASGGGFSLDATGFVGDAFTLSSFRCTAFGVTLRVSSGALSYRPNPPDVTLLLVSGHPIGLASDAEPYLTYAGDAGPEIQSALRSVGYRVETYAFVDHHHGTAFGDGYDDLVTSLAAVRDEYVFDRAFPTRVVVVAHSHGGVRAHQAIDTVSDVPVALLVDLDTSSCSFNGGHLNEPTPDPVDAWFIAGQYYDDEDVVPANVARNLEVRSGELCFFSLFAELYDDAYNTRTDGSATGLYSYDSDTSHSEVHDADGSTVPVVIDWMLYWLLRS